MLGGDRTAVETGKTRKTLDNLHKACYNGGRRDRRKHQARRR